jgi:hypothetical protein
MNTVTLRTERVDDDDGAREPRPIAVVMSEVLARYGLQEAPRHLDRALSFRPDYTAQTAGELAVA